MRFSRRFFISLFTSTAWWLGVALSCVLYILADRMVEDKNLAQFEYQTGHAEKAIETRIQSYVDVLRGTSALFASNNQLTRKQFLAYVKELNLAAGFPGVTNLNFARQVTAAEKKAFEQAVRGDTSVDPRGYPEFAIKPPGERAEYHVLTYLEPMESNQVSFGFDISSNPQGASSHNALRDSGQLISSGRLIRISGPHRHVGLAMRIPLYRSDMPVSTVDERRAAYYGSVGAGFDIDKLMTGAVDKRNLPHMRVRLYDTGRIDEIRKVGTTDPERLLFDNQAQPPAPGAAGTTTAPIDAKRFFLKRVVMTVGPRVWEAEFSADKAAMLNRFDANLPFLILAGCLLGTLLLYSIYYSLMSARRHAVELANDMTKDLRNSEASLAEAQHMAHLGSWLLDPASGRMSWSAETYRILGLHQFPGTPEHEDFLLRVHEEDRQRIREGLDQSITTGTEFNAEHRITRRDGSIRWVHTISRPADSDSESSRLLRGTLMDITERKHTVEALKRSQELLRELTAHQDRVKEEERRRIAREIHDELGQTLLALRIDVSMLDARTGKSHPKLNERVQSALHHIDATVKTIRTIINNLRPAVLDLGLTAAIEWQVNEFRRRSGISCDLIMGEAELTVDDARATTLFRVLQESLTNVIRHAHATRVAIELYRDHENLVMTITDNGIGIIPGYRKKANSFGLVGVEERINSLNGEFSIVSGPGKGTVLSILIPLEPTAGKLQAQPA